MMARRSRNLDPVTSIRLRALVGVVLLGALFAVGCSRTTDIGTGKAPPSPARTSTTSDPLNGQNLESGQAAIAKLQSIIDSMVASNDVCAILTQRDVPKNQLDDPSLLTSASARKVLSNGLIAVFNHLIQIGPAELQGAFSAEKDIFTQVLNVVNQYANDPQSAQATEQISTLVQSPGYLAAQAQITAWVAANCH